MHHTTPHSQQQPAQPDALLHTSTEFLDKLPPEVRPSVLAEQFPRIVNRLAATWGNYRRTENYLQELLINDRPQRQGFPFPVVKELMTLAAYYQTEVCATPRPSSAWDVDPRTCHPVH